MKGKAIKIDCWQTNFIWGNYVENEHSTTDIIIKNLSKKIKKGEIRTNKDICDKIRDFMREKMIASACIFINTSFDVIGIIYNDNLCLRNFIDHKQYVYEFVNGK